jgi:hypothetical protein
MKTQILDPDPENDSETCCKACGDEYELREHSEPTKYCDLCAHKVVERLERENKTLADALVKAAGYLASVRTDRKLIRDGDEYALQTMDWANGALEYAEAANAALETYDAAESANAGAMPRAVNNPKI